MIFTVVDPAPTLPFLFPNTRSGRHDSSHPGPIVEWRAKIFRVRQEMVIMAWPAVMPFRADLDFLRQLQSEIENFLKSHRHPIVVEDEEELLDLTSARWKLSIEFGKLLLEAWNEARSICRRVEEVAYRDRGRLGLFVRKPGGRETQVLELRDFQPVQRERPAERASGRARFRHELLGLLAREYRGWRFERVSNRSDREHSFSTWYTRGLARQGRTGWAFLALSSEETPAAADAALAYGLIWLDWLRSASERVTVSGLKLFLPPAALELTAHRAAYLNHHALKAEIFEWTPQAPLARPVDLKDFGNVETHLVPRRQMQALVDRHREALHSLLGDAFTQVDLVPDPSGHYLSVRVRGLEVARVEGQVVPHVYFGLEGSYRKLEENRPEEFRRFVTSVLEIRRARSAQPNHQFYRVQAERWLESLLLDDMTRVDPALRRDCVYPQVPAFAGTDRGVIDILSVTRAGRLAVIELKLQEDLNLPLQGLDYWMRVKWLAEREEFQPRGYFSGVEIAPVPPRLYLVSPAFRFHSSTDRMLRYLSPLVEIVQVGLNDQWREEVQVLFRRERSSVA